MSFVGDSPVRFWPLDEARGTEMPEPLLAVFTTLGVRITRLERERDDALAWSAELQQSLDNTQRHAGSVGEELARQKPETERFRRIANDWRALAREVIDMAPRSKAAEMLRERLRTT